jgi:predicted Zn-dependent protease
MCSGNAWWTSTQARCGACGAWACCVSRLDEGRFAEAEYYSRKAIELSPGDPRYHANLGVALARQNRENEAIEAFNTSLALQESSSARAGLAYVLARRGALERAEKEVRRALELQKENRTAQATLANILRKQRRWDEAIDLLRELAAKAPEEWEYQARLAETLREAGKTGEAIRVLKGSVAAAGSDPRRWEALARTMLAASQPADPAEAVRAARTGVELTHGRVPEHLDTLAQAYAAAGDRSRAEEAARRACNLAEQAGNSELIARCRATLSRLTRATNPS